MSIKEMIPARARRILKRVAGMNSSPTAAQPVEVVVNGCQGILVRQRNRGGPTRHVALARRRPLG